MPPPLTLLPQYRYAPPPNSTTPISLCPPLTLLPQYRYAPPLTLLPQYRYAPPNSTTLTRTSDNDIVHSRSKRSVKVSEADRTLLLAIHNRLRRIEDATDMTEMVH